MKKVLFIVSHLGSDSSILCRVLDKNPRIQWHQTNLIYDHPDELQALTSYNHKLKNSAAIWMDELLYNHHFSHKEIYKMVQFVYLIRDAKATLNTIIKSKEEAKMMLRYYIFRLRRIYEMAKRTRRNSVCMTWNDLASGNYFLEKFLELDEPLKKEESFNIPEASVNYDPAILEEGRKYYDRIFYLISGLYP